MCCTKNDHGKHMADMMKESGCMKKMAHMMEDESFREKMKDFFNKCGCCLPKAREDAEIKDEGKEA